MTPLRALARTAARTLSSPPTLRTRLPRRALFFSTAPPLRATKSPNPLTSTPVNKPDHARQPWRPAPHRDPDEPVYELYFTCKPCKHRSAHTISKQGYHRGTTLVQCPSCKARHLISDHLKIFADEPTTIEDILERKGERIGKGSIAETGDLEFWAEEAVHGRAKRD